MGRAAILVSSDELKAKLLEAEGIQKFSNWSELFSYVANTEWGKSRPTSVGSTKALSPATIYQRVMQFGLSTSLTTQKGKKGRDAGTVAPEKVTVNHTTLGKILRAKCDRYYYSGIWGNKVSSADVKRKRYLRFVKRLEGGSSKAAIALKCIDCCNGSFHEVLLCECKDCELYSLSPLTKKVGTP